MSTTGRWFAVSADICNTQHELHPHARGQKACDAFAWIDLIGIAAWRAHGGLERGQVRASVRFLAERWNWNTSRVQRFLETMEAKGAITRQKQVGREPGRITICNYDAYQSTRDANEPANAHANGYKEVQVQLPTKKRARARGNGDRKPARPAGPDMQDTYADPERIAAIRRDLGGRPTPIGEIDILDGLKRQVNGDDR